MKKRRPLITKKDMKLMVSTAKKKRLANELVKVQAILRDHFPGRKITNQMRHLLSSELDANKVERVHRFAGKELTSDRIKKFWNQLGGPYQATPDDVLINGDGSKPVGGILGGLTEEQTDVFDIERRNSIDDVLSDAADRGNDRALFLLMRRIGER